MSQYDDDDISITAELNKLKKPDISCLSLNEYLTKYTSEDNASFQTLHEQDREKFLSKIAWMFKDSERYKQINQLAIE